MKQLLTKLDDSLYNRFVQNVPEGERSEFTREAIEEKLSRKKIADDTGMEVLKFIQKMDPEAIIRKLIDQELVSQFTYEEIKKQNEVLKLILRRASFASTFSGDMLLAQDNAQRNVSEKLVLEVVANEIKQLGWGEETKSNK